MGLTAFLVVYLFGGMTFLPLLIAAIIYVYTKPVPPGDGADGLTRPGDDLAALENARREHGHEHDYDQGHRGGTEKKSRFDQHHHHVDDFATAGYFAVFREYVAIGVNSKPVEPSTVGPNTVAPPSPSVYQTFFRNMLTKKGSSSGGGAGAGGGVSGGKRVVGAAQGQGAVASAAALAAGAGGKGSGPVMVEVSSAASPRPKNARNMFYVVLRHGHLILFDDDQQVDVRHVIKLADHDVTVYAGAGKRVVPEGELFIKRNALQLKPRHPERAVRAHNAPVPQPWYLYSDNCAEKEDFYFALLRSQSQEAAGTRGGLGEPRARAIEVRHLTSLMERLHASEEAAEMRWLNALVGRMFLGVYQTPELAAFVKNKFVTKLSRAPRPGFVASLEVQRVDLGTTTPQITSPRLRSLTAEGECVVEADVRFTGHFGMDVAATLRVNTPIGTQEVRTSLAVAFTRLEGPVLFKIKAPPSNRLWFTFRHMPKVEMEIRPIIAARQLTWPLVIQMIEGKIKETIAESLVLPFWEDMPFFGTERKRWRGGVWEDDSGRTGDGVVNIVVVGRKGAVAQEEQAATAGGQRIGQHIEKVAFAQFPTATSGRETRG
ncbi:hypothetical protein CMQ_5318 [Grosmannia clavigera kw1407]|uniref:SMP-LTD domain-containing protein n=1 Tax=Grosmannia clavigera (strain kw1407 / UAMH 11150) TaxID=655863 RepID=F0XBN4_GROCL|nr:uncharacterized protein CMQ_5318 [Grosmannia clavigera kw1407]EFX05056.1 hypothetical protein CMQ_5318 [Grosmannia clavigera kw1407]